MLAASLGILWFVLCRHLSSEWSNNEQYSYGWFVPFFAAFLFWLRWENRPGKSEVRGQRSEVRNAIAIAIIALLILFPVRLFEIANPDWRPLSWAHALAVVGLTIAFLANCGRAFFLVWIAATQNLAAVERWHDLAGYAIVVAVFIGAVASAAGLAKGRSRKAKLRNAAPQTPVSIPHSAIRIP